MAEHGNLKPRNTLRHRLADVWFDFLARLTSLKIARIRLRQKNYPQFARHYGDFRFGEKWRDSSVRVVGNESGVIFGQVARMVRSIGTPPGTPPRSTLLAGESTRAKTIYASLAAAPESSIVTAGLHDDADCLWNFENPPPPTLGGFDLIVSHAILEHLINPYGHVRDLSGLLNRDGSLVLYTVTMGFPYHRHPVDCLRFFPDWFEEVADRLKLAVADRYLGDDHIVYRLRKP